MLLAFVVFWTFLEAFHEGLYDNGRKTISGVIEAALNILLAIIVIAWFLGLNKFDLDIPFWKAVVGFVLMRYFLFDFVYNITRKLPLTYVGATKIYDRLLSKVDASYIIFTKVCSGIVSIFFLTGIDHF
ncbi:MAG: hypothetical protein MUC78_13845 [Bacteroidales bacterium]|jgi:hypothetical protein|nr:hypothetical protein [Bacteroidales bacterium]